MNATNILAALGLIAQLAPVAESLVNTVKLAVSEGRDATDEELQAAVAGNQQASDALDAAIAQAKAEGR